MRSSALGRGEIMRRASPEDNWPGALGQTDRLRSIREKAGLLAKGNPWEQAVWIINDILKSYTALEKKENKTQAHH